ncbi:sensor domain-containing diguanylate cyclase, partial [Oceanobacillus massiliensis]|uniref:sensor domain-containing diguanylate cyclase n=1 Tax=Oceanobacillus massiliensis TaxID=1465765 RepID=UPI003019E44C
SPIFNRSIEKDSLFNAETVLAEGSDSTEMKSLHFTIDNAEEFQFVFSYSDKVPTEAYFEIVKRETSSLLHMISRFYTKKSNSWHCHELFELSKQILTANDMTTILTELSHVLRKNYTDISYCFLLSQDVEVSPALPVESLDYNQESLNSLSTKAFLTGELQIENMPEIKTTYIYAPLKGKQGIYGVLEINVPLVVYYPKMEKQFLVELTNLAGKAIEAATMFQRSKHQVSDLTLINKTSHLLNSNLDLLEIVSLVKSQILSTCQAAEIGFITINEDSKEVLSGSSTFFHTVDGRIFMNHLLERTNHCTEPLFCGDILEQDEIISDRFRSVMAFPVMKGGKVLGIVIVLHQESYRFTFDQFKLIQAIIFHSALAMANTILKDQLKKAVVTDYMTGLFTRNYLEGKVKEHMAKGDRGALILFDIDDFKQINDRYGHYMGDQVITQVADTLSNNIGADNIAARWGGEEMAIYAPEMSLEEGCALAEKVSRQVQLVTDPSVTLSSGVSAWNRGDGKEMLTLYLHSDKALYEAKNNGKNQVKKN